MQNVFRNRPRLETRIGHSPRFCRQFQQSHPWVVILRAIPQAGFPFPEFVRSFQERVGRKLANASGSPELTNYVRNNLLLRPSVFAGRYTKRAKVQFKSRIFVVYTHNTGINLVILLKILENSLILISVNFKFI